MNREWDEKRIRQLYRELRREDERRAPSFESLWRATVSETGGAPRRPPARALAAAAGTLILIGVTAALLVGRPWARRPPTSMAGAAASISEWQSPTVALFRSPLDPPTIAEQGQSSARFLGSNLLVTRWRSPTDYLLRSPDPQLSEQRPAAESANHKEL